jgi:hypothetical protein
MIEVWINATAPTVLPHIGWQSFQNRLTRHFPVKASAGRGIAISQVFADHFA